jgi:hypothetical protein
MNPRTAALRSAFVVLAGWAAWHAAAQSDTSLSVEIRDDATGAIVPAMACITSVADGSWRVPPDGSAQPPLSTLRFFYEPQPWQPAQIGPARKAGAGRDDNQSRSTCYEEQPSLPYWQEPAMYFVPQPFSIRLTPGKWRLAVAHGFELMPVREEFEIASGHNLRREIRLKRWVNMPREGWYSGDTHVHYPRTTAEQSDFILTWARAEDVHVTSVLSFGDIKQTYFPQMGYGRQAPYGEGDYLLASGQEDPRTQIPEQGHTIALDIRSTVRDVARYHLYDTMFDGVHRQGGITGYAHLAWAPEFHRKQDPNRHPTWDPNINAIRGKVDFFEILQFRHLGLEDYYDFLNLGVKLTAVAGSDMPWASSIGEVRTYVHTGRKFDAGAWYDGLKAGHTFITNGPMLTLTVDKAMPGDELKLKAPRKVRIQARAWAPAEIGAPKLLEVVADGKVIRSGTGEADFTLDVARSQWIAARVTAENGAAAHTSPVYVTVGGKSFRDESQVPELVAKRLAVLDFIEGRLRDARYTREYGPGEADALRERIAEARREYQRLAPAAN